MKVTMTYISQSSDFPLYNVMCLEDYIMDENQTFG